MTWRKTIFILIAAAVFLGVALTWWLGSARGFSTRQQPSFVEAALARQARRLAVPHDARLQLNPLSLTPQLLIEARRHFADHCSTCHANDGSGSTELGQNLYPKAPDMRQSATQSLTDGELYYIIHNGIRLTGMPAWGTKTGQDDDSWTLVHFIRHLPSLTAEELADMKQFNPKSPAEMQEEKEEEEFLNEKLSK